MDAVNEARGRRWADIVAILASVVLFGYSVGGGVLAGDSEGLREVRHTVGPMPTGLEERR